MSHDKYKITEDVLRAHYGHCFHYIAKDPRSSATSNIPTVEAARGTPFAQVTCVVEDVSIRMNMFSMGDFKPRGRNLIDFLLSDVKRAFAHLPVHTYVLAADMTVFGVEAKEKLQQTRRETAEARAKSLNVPLVKWDINNPTPLVELDREMPSLIAMQASPGVLRQVLFEAMTLIPFEYTPPEGKRLILHVEPRTYTNPASIDDFMPTDPSTGIVIAPDRVAQVEEARNEMRKLAQTETPTKWRELAREKTQFLARTGCFFVTPLCIETSITGIKYAPFRLPMMRFQCGEADLAIPRYVTYLHTGYIIERLVGDRTASQIDRMSHFYTAEQLASTKAALMAVGKREFYVGEGGSSCRQRTLVMSTDSDFCMLLAYAFSCLVADHNTKRAPGDKVDGYDLLSPHAPLLLRGQVLTRTRATLRRGERRTYYSVKNNTNQNLLLSHELFDPALFYYELLRGPAQTASPLELLRADAADRGRRASQKYAKTLAAKRAASDANEGSKHLKTESGVVARQSAAAPTDDAVDDEEILGPVVHLPPVSPTASPDEVFERFASFVMFTCMLGNDYLAGLQGVPRSWSYFGYAEMVRRHPDWVLVRALRIPGENDVTPKNTRLAAPNLPLIIHCGIHERIIAYSYYFNLIAQPHAKNKPTQDIDQMTIDDVGLVVKQKYSRSDKHIATAENRDRMARRLLWILAYFTCGTTNIRNILDPVQFGWDGEWRLRIV